jgi:predicted ATP-dependent protease
MKAIEQKIYRNSKYEEKLNEMFKDGTLLIDVDGEKIGQINGLVVMGTGEYSFGKPSRITVSTYKGKSGIINIEREVKKSGSIHDKGVLILSGFLGSRYAKEELMSLTVSISFEQNYSMIDGDSASSTELYAILSSIAEVPIKQSIAVTGSVNQMGEIQPIGGVNEKIEGFYDVCKLKGLTGEQGVIIPVQNVKNLMLKREVIDAVEKGQFHIYAISHVDQGIEILTGIPVGEKGENGEYPEGTLNYLIVKKLKELNEKGEKEREQ